MPGALSIQVMLNKGYRNHVNKFRILQLVKADLNFVLKLILGLLSIPLLALLQ